MVLHRDIYWVGRQWTVTGFGVQAVDQRLQGAFDVESSRLWDEGLQARMRAHAWVNGEDFDKALMLARQRFPEPARKALPLVESVLELIQQPAADPPPQQPMPPHRDSEANLKAADQRSPAAHQQAALPHCALPPLQLRMQGQLARFVPQWRVRR